MKLVFCLMLVGASAFSYAEQLQVQYKSFYSHVRKLNSEDTNALQFAFGFVNVRTQGLCTINKAYISTDKQDLPLTVSPEGRFTVPSEKALKMADALVVLDLEEAANICDMSVQLETKPEFLKTEYTNKDLVFLYEQYQAFFNEMGSFLSFLMPQVDGLRFQFEDENLKAELQKGYTLKAGMLELNEQELRAEKVLKLPQAPLRITASTNK